MSRSSSISTSRCLMFILFLNESLTDKGTRVCGDIGSSAKPESLTISSALLVAGGLETKAFRPM